MNWLISHYRIPARVLAWVGLLAIIVLSVVPAVDRPVSSVGPQSEHFSAFALVAGAFATGYDISLIRLVILAFFVCGGIEILQVPLPTRHARFSDFVIDFVASCFAIVAVFAGKKLLGLQCWNKISSK